MSRETKTLAFQVKAEGILTNAQGQEVGVIDAYGAMFNNVDDGNDRILPGAFVRTLKNSKARAKSREKDYMLKMLWQHRAEDVIGGWMDVHEDAEGLRAKGHVLLATQRGREYYELAKAGMIDEFSIIYEVMPGGSQYDSKDGCRDLSELRLYSIDPVTFAMNDSTYTVGVKSADDLEEKAVCGSTSGPIGPRDESWSGSKAEKQIWAAAYDEDSGKINTALAKKYFMVLDGDPQKKGSYGYPFWYVGSDPHISVGAVKAIAGAISGARGASAPDGLKAKVETLYNRINRKYPDDPQLVPPWKSDDGKGSRNPMEKKTFAEHLAEEQCEDLLEDFQDVLVCALCDALYDAFRIGDNPEFDAKEALTAFNDAVMEWVADGIKYDLSGYLEAHTNEYSSADSLLQYGSESRPNYGYMSRRRLLSRKAGRAISAANGERIQDHIDTLNGLADSHEKAMKAHVKAVRSTADDLATILQGSESAYGSDAGNAGDEQEGKQRGTPSQKTRTTHTRPSSSDTVNEQDIAAALSKLRSLHA